MAKNEVGSVAFSSMDELIEVTWGGIVMVIVHGSFQYSPTQKHFCCHLIYYSSPGDFTYQAPFFSMQH